MEKFKFQLNRHRHTQADYLLWMSYVLQRPIERDFIAGVGVKSVHFVQRIFLLFLVC